MKPRASAALILAALALVAGCGGETEDEGPERMLRLPETADPLPKLPARWEPHLNRSGGFAFGLPPGWDIRDSGISSLVRSFDRLVAVSITPDRTSQALELPLEDFATRTLAALPVFDGEVDAGPARRIPHRYRALRIEATGTAAESGLRQRIQLIVVRRERRATFTVVIAASADRRARPSERLAERVVETLRSRPVTLSPGP